MRNEYEIVVVDELIAFNMSFGIDSETASLTALMRHQAKYGSTANHVIADQSTKYITHIVSSNDTLQGLALKYEVSMEQIKRANKLWSSDNLTLRSRTTLNIPKLCETRSVTTFDSSSNDSSCTPSPKLNLEQSLSSPQSTNCNTSSLECEDIPLDDETAPQDYRHHRSSNSRLKNGFKMASLILADDSDRANHDQQVGYPNTDEDESAADFLIRIDSSIAKSKDKVKNMQQNRISGTHSDDDLFRLHQNNHRSGLRRHHSQSSRSRTNSTTNSSSLNDINNLPQPLVMTHDRKVISSMKRLEKAQDEIFEL